MRELLIVLLVLPLVLLFVFTQRVQEFRYEPVAAQATPQPVVVATVSGVPRPAQPVVPTPVVGAGAAPVAPAGLIDAAMSWLGVPYLWGGCSRRGVDCSCFVQNVLAVIGIAAPRTTTTQVVWATPVSREQARLGDLVFFDNTCVNCGPNPTHVGLYLGNGLMIDAGDPVKIEPVYWGKLHSIGRPRGL